MKLFLSDLVAGDKQSNQLLHWQFKLRVSPGCWLNRELSSPLVYKQTSDKYTKHMLYLVGS